MAKSIETGAAIKAREVIVPWWLQETIKDGGGDAALFEVDREVTPFGNYLMSVKVVSA